MDLSSHKEFDIEEFQQAFKKGGYITIPQWGIPGHSDWAPGSRQWIAAGTGLDGSTVEGGSGGMARTQVARAEPGTVNPRTAIRIPPGVGGSSGAPGSVSPDNAGGVGTSAYGVNYDAIRERAIAPTRALYSSAIRNLNRQKALGVSSPGYGAQLAKLTRGMSQGMADASIGAEASISDMMLREKQMAQDYALRSRGLDISEKALPSGLTQGLSNVNQAMQIASAGAGAAGTIYDIYNRNRQQGGGGSTGTSIAPTQGSGIIPSGYGNMFGGGGGFQTPQFTFGNQGGYRF